MIRPMSKKRRMIMLAILIAVFICAGPLLLLLSSGYSFKDVVSLTKISILRTGGVYVASIGNKASVFVDSKLSGTSSFLDRSVLVQGLTTKQHSIRVERTGFRNWEKKLTIPPNKVIDIHPVLISEKVSFVITKNPVDISALTKAYEKKIDLIISTSTGDIIFDDDTISLSFLKNDVSFVWKDVENVPQFMCTEEKCEENLHISFDEKIIDAEFYKGGLDGAVVLGQSNIFITELDPRGGRISTPVFSANDFKIENFNKSALVSYKGSIYLKISKNFYKLNLEPVQASS